MITTAYHPRYPTRLETVYCWRKRRPRLVVLTDIGKPLPVPPPDVEEYVPVAHWSIDDCIMAVLRKAPGGLTPYEIAERIGDDVHQVQRCLSQGRETLYAKTGRRKAPSGNLQTVWAIADKPMPIRNGKPATIIDRVAHLLHKAPGLSAHDIAERLGLELRPVRDALHLGRVQNRFYVVGKQQGSYRRPRHLWAVVGDTL